MDQERKFKVGDVVRPAPNRGWSPSLMGNTYNITKVDTFEGRWVTVERKNPIKRHNQSGEFNLEEDDIVLAEEVVVDNILTKYGW